MISIKSRKKSKKNGLKKSSRVTIDLIELHEKGFRIVGWYLKEQVSSVAIVECDGTRVIQELNSIVRPDVEAATGMAATGFSLYCNTDKKPVDCELQVNLLSGDNEHLALGEWDRRRGAKPEASKSMSAQDRQSLSVAIEAGYCEAVICTEKYLALTGWLLEHDEISDLYVCDEEGARLTGDVTWLRSRRPDVQEAFGEKARNKTPGILACMELAGSKKQFSDNCHELIVEVGTAKKRLQVNTVLDHEENRVENMARILGFWNPREPGHLADGMTVVSPLISQFAVDRSKLIVQRHDFCVLPEFPSASVIIPLYGRYDFMRLQISRFNACECFQNMEVIYVVDDPSISEKVLSLAVELEATFVHPFSVLVLSENMGFGMANNVASEFAQSDNLILLNSDVLPSHSDWAEDLVQRLDSLPDAGFVGTRLLFEDDSIQHDGMHPVKLAEYPGLYFNDHPHKGWPVSMSPLEEKTAACEMVTAACVAVKKSLFESLGGFDPKYVLGDFEDSDLCLQARAAGKVNYICRDITLHHLERQSQNLVMAGDWKHKLTIVNAINFNQRWHTRLAEMYDVSFVGNGHE